MCFVLCVSFDDCIRVHLYVFEFVMNLFLYFRSKKSFSSIIGCFCFVFRIVLRTRDQIYCSTKTCFWHTLLLFILNMYYCYCFFLNLFFGCLSLLASLSPNPSFFSFFFSLFSSMLLLLSSWIVVVVFSSVIIRRFRGCFFFFCFKISYMYLC